MEQRQAFTLKEPGVFVCQRRFQAYYAVFTRNQIEYIQTNMMGFIARDTLFNSCILVLRFN